MKLLKKKGQANYLLIDFQGDDFDLSPFSLVIFFRKCDG